MAEDSAGRSESQSDTPGSGHPLAAGEVPWIGLFPLSAAESVFEPGG